MAMFSNLKKKLGKVKETAKEEEFFEDVKLELAPETMRGSEEVLSEGRGGKKLKDKKIDDFIWELELALLESDVALPVVEAVKEEVKEELGGRRIRKGLEADEAIELALRSAIEKILSQEVIEFDSYIKNAEKPVVMMFVGVNGTGKTTAIARVAHRLKKNKHSCVLAAGDTFRAGAIEQLKLHADKLGLKMISHQAGADPAAIAFDAVEHAKARRKDVVLIDTAGRMQTNLNLMDEMKKIDRTVKPDMTVFVGDALAGNDAVEQAEKFNEAVGIDAVILTKIDADAKGGAALSIAHTVGKPILFLGVGQGYDDLIPFHPKWLVERIFGEE